MQTFAAYISWLLCLTAFAVVVYRWWCTPEGKGLRPLPPMASGVPFIGDTFTTISLGPVGVGRQRHSRLGHIYRSWFVGEKQIHIGDAASVKQLLNAEHDLVEGEWISTIRQLLGRKSISVLSGKQHIQVRRLLTPAFTPKVSQQYIPRITEIAQEMCAKWAGDKFVKGEDSMKAFTFQVATELIVGFGRDFINQKLLARHQKLWTDWTGGFLALPINLPGFAFHKAMKARAALLAEYEAHIADLQDKVVRSDGSQLRTSMEKVIEAAQQDPFMDMEFLKDVALNLLFAGHDTSSSALVMLLRFLKLNPQALQKLRDEQKQVVQRCGGSIDAESLKMMPYADAATQETMRLAAIVSIAPKVALKTFEIGGFTVPKGHKLQLELWKVLEEDARWWGEAGPFAPSHFNPDRWMTEEGKRTGSHIPFGSGQRMCIGYAFALQEIKIMLAVLARDYDWEVNLEEPVKTFPLPMPVQSLPMTFSKLRA